MEVKIRRYKHFHTDLEGRIADISKERLQDRFDSALGLAILPYVCSPNLAPSGRFILSGAANFHWVILHTTLLFTIASQFVFFAHSLVAAVLLHIEVSSPVGKSRRWRLLQIYIGLIF